MKRFLLAALLTLPLMFGASTAMAKDTVGASVEFDRSYDVSGSYEHVYDEGTTLGASVSTLFGSGATLSGTRYEGQVGQNLNVLAFQLYGRAGIGGEFTTGNNFAYYQANAGLNVDLTDSLAWNAVNFRYRDAFDHNQNFRSERVRSGLTYEVLPDLALSAGGYYDLPLAGKPSDVGLIVGVSHSL